MIITIGGLAGSGTTTVSKILSDMMGIPYISAGDIFRQMAIEHDMDILEFSRYAEENVQIDRQIDQKQAEIAGQKDELIVEGRLSAYFVDADLKVCLTTPLDVSAERVSKRENKTPEIAKSEIIKRGKSEAKRYQEIHNIDINSLDTYDLIINSHSFSPESIAHIILKASEQL